MRPNGNENLLFTYIIYAVSRTGTAVEVINMKSTAKNTFNLTVTALFCALIIALTFIPYTGYIVYGLLSITTIHVVVILGATLFGPAKGTLFGAVWGITCLLYALANGTADAAIFLNPLISVVPRIFVGLLAGWYFVWFSKLFGKWWPEERAKTAAALCTAILGTLTNTALVLSAISVFGTGILTLGETLKTILKTALALNGVVETVLAAVLVTVLNRTLRKTLHRYQ